MGEGISCECSFLVTNEDLGWSEVAEPTQLETLEDGLIGPVWKLGREFVSSAFINNDDKRSVPKKEQVGLNNLVELGGQSALNFWPVLCVCELHTRLAQHLHAGVKTGQTFAC